MKVHGDSFCFMVKIWARHKTTETVLNNGWRLVAVGGWRLVTVGSVWHLAIGGWWRLVAVGGGWRLAVGGPWGLSFTEKKMEVLKDSPASSPIECHWRSLGINEWK